MQNRNDSHDENELNPEEKALREKLLSDGDETNLDRSVSRDGEGGGGFGEGHYTGTSWDPEINPNAPTNTSGESEHRLQDAKHRSATAHDDDYGAAGAGRFGGVKGPGLTTGAASPTTPR